VITVHRSVLLRLPNTGFVLLAVDAVMIQHRFALDRRAWPDDENESQSRASTGKLLRHRRARAEAALVVFGHDRSQWQALRTVPSFYD
jgi:N-acyl homoserine lactone hydrolase